MGKKSGIATIDVFLDKYGLEATDKERKLLLDVVKRESTVRKNAISDEEFLKMYPTIKDSIEQMQRAINKKYSLKAKRRVLSEKGYQRGLWPFESISMSITSSSFNTDRAANT